MFDDEFPINYTLVSPSKVGDYAACTQRLVWDSDSPRPYTSSKWADFGTVCHYVTQYKLGCMGVDPPTDEQMASAQTLVGSEQTFHDRLEACSDLAISLLPQLPAGVSWLAEVPVHDKALLPQRKARKSPHKVEGFGGSIDLMSSNRSVIVDLKFPTRPPETFHVSYFWQLASYAMLSGVMKTKILWIMTTGKSYYTADIDWEDSRFAPLIPKVRRFVERTGHKNFRSTVYPMAGAHCKYCDHKERCAAANVPSPLLGSVSDTKADDMAWLTGLGKAPTPTPVLTSEPLF